MSATTNFATAAAAFAALVRQIPADAWSRPGLGEWDLRELVGHTSRSLLTVESYLGQPAEREECPSAEAYYAATAAVDPAQVAARGRAAGVALGSDPVAFVDDLVRRVPPLVDRADDPLITTAAGGMRLSAYVPTRTFELVVHGLDIAAAAGLHVPSYPEPVLTEVLRLAAGAAVLRGEGLELLAALCGRAPLRPGFSVV